MKKRLQKIKSILSIVLMISMMICTAQLSSALENESDANGETAETVDVVVLTGDLNANTKIKGKDVKVIKVKKNANLPENIISSAQDVIGKYTTQKLFEGEYVIAKSLSDKLNEQKLEPIGRCKSSYLVVTDFIRANSGEDIAKALQELIDANPKRTVYFPDGEYLISKPIKTSASPASSTMIVLSDHAVIKATKDFTPETITAPSWWTKSRTNTLSALICIGAGKYANDNQTVGSYYGIIGGTLDGNGVADGVSVDSGRETVIYNVTVKNPKNIGIHIKEGSNGGSSDADVENVTIIGGKGATGILVVGFDNTFTDARIYGCDAGSVNHGGGNVYRGMYIYGDGNTTSINSLNSGNFYFHNIAEGCLDYNFFYDAMIIWNK